MNYSFHAGAEQDVTSAQDFYEQHAGLQVATRFLDELQHVIPTKEKWKIDSAKQFFKALQELPELKEKGVQIHYQSKINGESLTQLISGIK